MAVEPRMGSQCSVRRGRKFLGKQCLFLWVAAQAGGHRRSLTLLPVASSLFCRPWARSHGYQVSSSHLALCAGQWLWFRGESGEGNSPLAPATAPYPELILIDQCEEDTDGISYFKRAELQKASSLMVGDENRSLWLLLCYLRYV